MNESKYHVSTPIGIHRLRKEPFDDREIFSNISDLIDYCKHGASYNGQKVLCIFNQNDNEYLLNFIINNGYPILQLNNIENNIIKDNDADDYYILIYHHNPISNKQTESSKSFYNIINPDAFSITGLINIFKDDNDYYFKAIIKNKNNINTTQYIDITQEQNKDPLIKRPFNYSVGARELFYSSVSDTLRLKIDNTKYVMDFSNDNNYIIDLYIKATDYVKSMGVL